MIGPLAVHISDGVLADPWWVGGFVGAAALLALAARRVSEDEIPRIGVLTAAFFVASSVHFKVAGTSVHLILNGLVGVVLGRRAPLAVTVGLFLQALLLGHGGYTTLGLNACVVGIPALLAGWAYPVLRSAGVPAFATGCALGFAAAGLTVALNFLVLFFGGKDDLTTLAKLVLIPHSVVVLVEGLMLGVIVRYVERVKPELLARASRRP